MRKLTICLGCLVLILLSVSMAVSTVHADVKCGYDLRGVKYIPGFGGTNVFLNGFYLRYGDRYHNSKINDNHVKRIRILPGTTSTTVALEDKNASSKGDVYRACVNAISVPVNYDILTKTGTCKAQKIIYLDYKPNHTIFIRGFSFTKNKDDMHIKQVAIKSLEPGRSGKTFIAFGDKDKKDKFYYEIGYTNIPNSQIKQKIVLNKNAKKEASQSYVLSDPSAVPGIVSFSFMFRDKDHHLGIIGLESGWGDIHGWTLRMRFQDKNGDDKVNYFAEVYYFDPNPQAEVTDKSGEQLKKPPTQGKKAVPKK